MPEGSQHDVTVTLSELERRLIELERELQEVSAPAPPGSPAPADEAPSVPAATPDRGAPAPAPAGPSVEALLAFRETLATTMRELLDAYEQLIEHLPGDGDR